MKIPEARISLVRGADAPQGPACPFTEIGRVTAQTGAFVSWGRVVRQAREKASAMGGDPDCTR